MIINFVDTPISPFLSCRSYIENETAKQADPSVRGMMQNEFQGETVKIISCSKCNKSFQSAEAFYELILTIQVSGSANVVTEFGFGFGPSSVVHVQESSF